MNLKEIHCERTNLGNVLSPGTAMDHTLATVESNLPLPVSAAALDGTPQPLPEVLEEALVADARAHLTPAQMVERKLLFLLKSNPLPVSHMMTVYRPARSR